MEKKPEVLVLSEYEEWAFLSSLSSNAEGMSGRLEELWRKIWLLKMLEWRGI